MSQHMWNPKMVFSCNMLGLNKNEEWIYRKTYIVFLTLMIQKIWYMLLKRQLIFALKFISYHLHHSSGESEVDINLKTKETYLPVVVTKFPDHHSQRHQTLINEPRFFQPKTYIQTYLIKMENKSWIILEIMYNTKFAYIKLKWASCLWPKNTRLIFFFFFQQKWLVKNMLKILLLKMLKICSKNLSFSKYYSSEPW